MSSGEMAQVLLPLIAENDRYIYGLYPLDGLAMGTRCGAIDPAVVTFIMHKEGSNYEQMDEIMNKKSGVLAISGVSSDFRDLDTAVKTR